MELQYKRLFLSLIFIVSLLIQGQSSALEGKKRVLVLHSYHQGFQWTDRIMEGIYSGFKDNPNIELFINYMDTKRQASDDYFQQLKVLYTIKYANIQFDAIISSDDNALDFLLEYRDQLFPGTPVIFSGLNAFPENRLQGQKGFSGIYESYDVEGTIKLMTQLHPATQSISVVTDNTRSGLIFKKLIEQVESKQDGSNATKPIRFNYLHNLPVIELQRALVKQPQNSLVLWAIYIKTPEGDTLSIPQSVGMVSSFSPVPTYCIWDVVGQGVVGGKITDPNYQGRYAAQLALRILAGESPDNIPVIGSPLVNIFDYRVMQKFGINQDEIPQPSVIINQPESFYQLYRNYIFLLVAILLLLMITIIYLASYIVVKRKRDKLELMAMHDQLTGLHNRHFLEESVPQRIAEATRHGETVCLLALDLDHFKKINDTSGHAMGDKVLVLFADLLRHFNRREDIIARIGGEEFVILLSHCNIEEAAEKAELLRAKTESLKPENIALTASIGVTEYLSDDEHFSQALDRADKAVYVAKRRGRNCVIVG